MGFWGDYRKSLKPAEVEEPIDRFLHRPIAYVLARLVRPLPIPADAITVASIFLGWGGAACLLSSFAWHLQVGALLIFLSAIFDCADGQLARMRGTSSAFGRMIDGVADLLVVCAVAPASLYLVWRKYHNPTWLGLTVVALGIVTMVTSSFHTGMYDHYKNVWLRFTNPSYKEGEDYETALARYERTRGEGSLFRALSWRIYLFYVKSQEGYVRGFDPNTTAAIGKLPSYSKAREEIYRASAARPFAMLRSMFGFGSLVFGLALFNAIDRQEFLLLFRLVPMNLIFYFWIRPLQREASRQALGRMRAETGDAVAESG